jgi:hypothetical protein
LLVVALIMMIEKNLLIIRNTDDRANAHPRRNVGIELERKLLTRRLSFQT